MNEVNSNQYAMAMLNIAENHSYEMAMEIMKKYSESKEDGYYAMHIYSDDAYFSDMSPYNFIHDLSDIGMTLRDNGLITRFTMTVTDEMIRFRFTY